MEISPLSVNDICCMIPPWFGSTVPGRSVLKNAKLFIVHCFFCFFGGVVYVCLFFFGFKQFQLGKETCSLKRA